jgi:hypothetical protein
MMPVDISAIVDRFCLLSGGFRLIEAAGVIETLEPDKPQRSVASAFGQFVRNYHGYLSGFSDPEAGPVLLALLGGSGTDAARDMLSLEEERIRSVFHERHQALSAFAFAWYAMSQLDGFRLAIWLERSVLNTSAPKRPPEELVEMTGNFRSDATSAIGLTIPNKRPREIPLSGYEVVQVVADYLTRDLELKKHAFDEVLAYAPAFDAGGVRAAIGTPGN